MLIKTEKTELPSTKKGRKRLLTLAKLLEKDARNAKGLKFDMNIWGLVESDDNDKPLYKAGLNCHTTACAMGLAALSGKFSRQGLRYKIVYGDVVIWMKGTPSDGISAAEKLFDIDREAAEWLFGGSSYYSQVRMTDGKGELRVAKRIRDYVTGKLAPYDVSLN